jgi:hypothetical protein
MLLRLLRIWLWAPITGLFLIVAACGSSGRDFARPDADSLVLGRTTVAEIVGRYGPPTSRSVRHSLNPAPSRTALEQPLSSPFGPAIVAGTIETLSYRYSETNAAGLVIVGPVKSNAKQMRLSFWDDRLFSFSFESAFDSDSTNFEEGKISSFAAGRSVRADVVRELGRPSGEAVYPYLAQPGTRLLLYAYGKTEWSGWLPSTREFVHTRKMAAFLFDASDKLIESRTATSFAGN